MQRSISSVNPASFDPTNLQQGAVEEAQFKNAINYVVDLYDHLFTNNVTVNIAFSWGEINGQTVAGRGTNKEHSVVESYADVLKALTTGAQSVVQKSADGMLPTVGDFTVGTGNSIALTYAQAKALDFMNAHGTESDGTVAFGAGCLWDFDPSASTPMGENDLVATAEHEISELMGRTSGDGRPDPHINNNPAWTVMDFFRYSSPGQRDTQPGTAASNSTALFFRGRRQHQPWDLEQCCGPWRSRRLGQQKGPRARRLRRLRRRRRSGKDRPADDDRCNPDERHRPGTRTIIPIPLVVRKSSA